MDSPSRTRSGRVPMQRRTTRGPLDDVADDPLAASTPEPQSATSSQLLSPTSPQGRALSPSIRSRGQSPLPSAAASPSLHGVDDLPSKDYSHLLRPENFHPLPSTTIPAPFLNSPHQPTQSTPIPELLRNGHFRAAAISSALALTTGTDPTDAQTIFNLLHTRLSCLVLLNQQALAAQEVKCLGDLTSTFYRHPLTGEHAVPWDLRVLAVRLNALGFGEWRRGIMGYYELAREARSNVVKAIGDETGLWKDRLRELGIRVANALVEMGDFEGAGKHLTTLARGNTSQEIREMEVLVWLRVGDLSAAKRCLSTSDEDASLSRSLEALALMADGDYRAAADLWQLLLEEQPGDWLPLMNAAICSLYTGHMDEARSSLEKLVDHGVSFPTLLFNLATVYELCTERARDRKMDLVDQVAAQEPKETGWERAAVEFKL